ncbi:MAG TPA: tripartite tricarboxylate transporter substrate binding protein [Burkholderiales bacterium]|nr:tripartite tricarboxylate transporter substrate binding protein [Burkholderiales bacterium]
MKKILLIGLAALFPFLAQAQSWPSRPVKFILSLGPGSGADLTGRMLADRLSKQWGQPVVVENRPGADAVLAINAVIAAKDDHTLLYGPSGSFVGHPYTLERVPYDRNELLPVARVSNTVVVLAAPASLKAQSLKEVMQMVREEPGKLNYASVTQVYDIMMAAYLKSAGLDMARITYKDAVSAQNDLVEGRIQLYSAAYAIVRGHAQGGRIRILAVQNRTRAPGLEAPTAAEAGFPELTLDGLVGLMAARSSGIGDAVRERIAADVKTHLNDPALNERMTATGQIVNPGTPAEFAAAIDEQSKNLASWSKAIGGKLK